MHGDTVTVTNSEKSVILQQCNVIYCKYIVFRRRKTHFTENRILAKSI